MSTCTWGQEGNPCGSPAVRDGRCSHHIPDEGGSDLTFTVEEGTAISQAFGRGNYANAYESTDLAGFKVDEMPEHERAAFVLGFYGTYSLDEIDGEHRDLFDECYWSPAGQYVVTVAGYTDSRAAEYAAEACAAEYAAEACAAGVTC